MEDPVPYFPEQARDTLAELAWSDLVTRMRCPVMVGRADERARIVEVLGAMRYLVEPANHRVHMAYGRGNGRFERGGDTDFVSLDPLLPGMQWVGLFLHDWIAGRMSHLDPPAKNEAVRSVMRSRAREIVEWRAREAGLAERLRSRIERALGLDPDVLRWAKLGRPDGARAALNSHEYSTIWRHALRLRQLERENPRLVRAYAGAALCGLGPDRGEPAHGLKERILGAGVGKAGWKLLCNTPAQAFRVPLRMAANDFTFDVYVWAINTFLAARGVLPGAVLERLIAPHFREPRRGACLEWVYEDTPDEWHAFLRALGGRVAQIAGEAEMARFLDEELVPVHDWFDATGPSISANQARAGWPWLMRQAREWERFEREQALALRATHHWPVPLPGFDSGPLRAVALRDSFELWQEGHAMRHCVRLYVKPCLEGRYAIFSVRNRPDDRNLATVSLTPLDGRWAVHQVRVFANRDAGPALNAFAQALATACGKTQWKDAEDSIGEMLVDLEVDDDIGESLVAPAAFVTPAKAAARPEGAN